MLVRVRARVRARAYVFVRDYFLLSAVGTVGFIAIRLARDSKANVVTMDEISLV